MSDLSTRLFRFLNRTSLVAQIVVGLIAGVVLALLAPEAARSVGLLGDLFVAALKAGSVSLLADSADFLEDAAVNILIFFALAWTATRR